MPTHRTILATLLSLTSFTGLAHADQPVPDVMTPEAAAEAFVPLRQAMVWLDRNAGVSWGPYLDRVETQVMAAVEARQGVNHPVELTTQQREQLLGWLATADGWVNTQLALTTADAPEAPLTQRIWRAGHTAALQALASGLAMAEKAPVLAADPHGALSDSSM